MKYKQVCIESVAYTLPEEVVTSDQLEDRLEPLYGRLRLNRGMLRAMSGISERRFWPRGVLPSEKSIESAVQSIRMVDIDKRSIGALIHGSVCRDYLEPATACVVHHQLGLPSDCLVYDVSNACLGMLNGMVQVANMIELGQIRAGIVVGTESSRQLADSTIELLNTNTSLSRAQVNNAIASLTIGSGSAAVLLVDRMLSRTQNRLLSVATGTCSSAYRLCRTGFDESIAGAAPMLIETISAPLLDEGIALIVTTFGALLAESGWSRGEIHKTFCHQVGTRQRKLALHALALEPTIDFSMLESLGNTGAVALPLTMALGIEHGHVQPNERLALMGVGSGINSIMLAVEWQRSIVGEHSRQGAQSNVNSRMPHNQRSHCAAASPDHRDACDRGAVHPRDAV